MQDGIEVAFPLADSGQTRFRRGGNGEMHKTCHNNDADECVGQGGYGGGGKAQGGAPRRTGKRQEATQSLQPQRRSNGVNAVRYLVHKPPGQKSCKGGDSKDFPGTEMVLTSLMTKVSESHKVA